MGWLGPMRGAGLRLHLALLLCATLLPALVAGGFAAWSAAHAHSAAFEARLLDTAHTLRLALDSEVASVEATLAALATSPPLLRAGAGGDAGPDLAAFHAHARRRAERLGTSIGLVDRDGRQILVTDRPFGVPLPPSPRRADVQRALAEGRTVLSGVTTMAASSQFPAAVIEPARRPTEAPPGQMLALVGRLDPEQLSGSLAAQGLSPSAVATLFDGQGRVVARSRNLARFFGGAEPAWFREATGGRGQGLVVGPGLDGATFITGFDRLRHAPDWIVTVAEPWSAYRATWTGPLLAFGGGGLAALAAAAGIGVWLTRRLLRPVDALARGARAIALDPAGRVGIFAAVPPAGIAEFEQMRLGLAEAERTLRTVESRQRDLLATLDLGACMARAPDGVILFWSEGCARLYGWTATEAVGQVSDLLLRTAFPVPRAVIAAALERDGEWTGDLRQRTRDGREVIVAVRKVLRRDAEGRPAAVMESVTDVTAQRRAEAALAESEERLRLALEGGRLGSWDLDLRTRRGVWSAQAAVIWGLSEGGSAHDAWRARVHPEDLPALDAAFIAHLQGRMPRHEAKYRYRHPDGSWRWIASAGRVVARDAATGKALRVAGVVQDITERKAAEERQALLTREVDHRARNTLAVVQSIVSLTRADEPLRFAEAVKGRVAALARAHTLLARDRWHGADLRSLAQEEFSPYEAGGPRRVQLDGPSVGLAPDAVQPLAMALHELATNAAKHGALSVPEGRVTLTWQRDPEDGGLQLRWRELDGPPLQGPPAHRSFGSKVVEATIRRQLGGEVVLRWEPAGLSCDIRIPPERLRWRLSHAPAEEANVA